MKAGPSYTARVFVDGIDRKKAAELTNALRLRGVSLEMVRGRRDESEPAIRLADMWAGCVRAATLGRRQEESLLRRALDTGYIRRTQEKTP
jgi:electron transfer flavoprotein alpha/beta subunit